MRSATQEDALRSVIFLDIDGVLNHPVFREPKGSPMINPDNAKAFNRIAAATQAEVVISSTWRAMILNGSMTAEGFGVLLLTHRVRCRVVGATPKGDYANRSQEISAWLAKNEKPLSYVVIDDDNDCISDNHPFVQTDGNVGLTETDADQAIDMLRGKS